MLHRPRRRPIPCVAALASAALAACAGSGGGGSTSPVGGLTVPPELLACRARVTSTGNFSEIALRSATNLGTKRVGDKSGVERRARLHPDGHTVVFARERTAGTATTRELFTSTTDGSDSEHRLTQNNGVDDEPCWAPGGAQILFTSDRGGSTALWRCDADGQNAAAFLLPPAGVAYAEADWCAATDRIVFAAADAGGHRSLWLIQGNGGGLVQLTDGGPGSGPDSGDQDPAFTPDGSVVWFARHLGATGGALCAVDVATQTVVPRYQTAGTVALPRLSPQLDRVFFGLAEPLAGRPTLRLAEIPTLTGAPALVWPDNRYALEGIDFLPAFPAAPATAAPQTLDVTQAKLEIAFGTNAFGARRQLAAQDNDALIVVTGTFNFNEVAGITVRYDLPLADALLVRELRFRIVASVSRYAQGAIFKASVQNPTDGRDDTACEVEPTGTGPVTLEFATTSLRHVAAERQVRLSLSAEVPPGPRCELHVDLVELVMVARAP